MCNHKCLQFSFLLTYHSAFTYLHAQIHKNLMRSISYFDIIEYRYQRRVLCIRMHLFRKISTAVSKCKFLVRLLFQLNVIDLVLLRQLPLGNNLEKIRCIQLKYPFFYFSLLHESYVSNLYTNATPLHLWTIIDDLIKFYEDVNAFSRYANVRNRLITVRNIFVSF